MAIPWLFIRWNEPLVPNIWWMPDSPPICRLYECRAAAKVRRKPCSREHLTARKQPMYNNKTTFKRIPQNYSWCLSLSGNQRQNIESGNKIIRGMCPHSGSILSIVFYKTSLIHWISLNRFDKNKLNVMIQVYEYSGCRPIRWIVLRKQFLKSHMKVVFRQS